MKKCYVVFEMENHPAGEVRTFKVFSNEAAARKYAKEAEESPRNKSRHGGYRSWYSVHEADVADD